MKLKDIRENIGETVDIKKTIPEVKLEVLWDSSDVFRDVTENIVDDEILPWEKIILNKNYTKNFDPLSKKWFFTNDISLSSKKNKIQKVVPKVEIPKIKSLKGYKLQKEDKYFAAILWFFLFIGIFVYKDVLEKYINYSYETLSYVSNDFTDYNKIHQNIQEAKNGFSTTERLFKPISFFGTNNTKNADRLIQWGKKLTEWFESGSRIVFDLLVLMNEKEVSEILFSHFLDNSKNDFNTSLLSIKEASQYYDDITDLWDPDLNKKFFTLKNHLSKLLEKGQYISDNYDVLLWLLWHYERKKYMIVFQNSDEIRPQWGFMGSVWFIEMFGWKIQSFEKKDIYALEWEINKNPYREIAPEWLDKITGTFWLRDANYFVWTAASSYKIQELLQRADIQIDGIIYTNINLALDIIDGIWWFDSEVLGKKVDSNNFSLLMSSLVESKNLKLWTLWSPKDILFDFIDELSKELKQKKDYNVYAEIFMENIASRDIFMYTFDTDEQKLLSELGIDGAIDYNDTLDYNYPVFTSISWNKSDRYIQRSYTKYVSEFDNCIISTRLNVKLEHNFTLIDETETLNIFDEYDINIWENLDIQWKWNNRQFVRIVLPKNSIIKNDNVMVKNYPNTRVVEFYMDTPRLESSYFVLSYLIPNEQCREYDYTLYKQPWIKEYDLEMIVWEKNHKMTWITKDFEYKLE